MINKNQQQELLFFLEFYYSTFSNLTPIGLLLGIYS